MQSAGWELPESRANRRRATRLSGVRLWSARLWITLGCRSTLGCICGVILLGFGSVPEVQAQSGGRAPAPDSVQHLALQLRKLATTGRLLYVTAHPDDEDSALLSYLHHGSGVETALLTLTRGEGGQNEIGAELFHALGVLRSREQQAASAFTGARQFFSRAYEFGYSFSVEETLEKWHGESILRDIVRVIRRFRPDVILTMLQDGDGGGQHHQASARLTRQAFQVAASDRWPELGPPHQARRLFRQIWDDEEQVEFLCAVPVSKYDPLLGCSHEQLGLSSRAMHKCQGMARLSRAIPRRQSRWEWLEAIGEERRKLSDPFEGLPLVLLDPEAPGQAFDRPWRKEVAGIQKDLSPEDPGAIVAPLLNMAEYLEAQNRPPGPGAVALRMLKERLAECVRLAAGVRWSARTPERWLAAGGVLPLIVSVENAGRLPVRMQAVLQGPEGLVKYLPALELAAGEQGAEELQQPLRAELRSTLPQPVPDRGDAPQDDGAFIDPRWSSFSCAATLDISGFRLRLPPRPVECAELSAEFPAVFHSDPQVVPDPSVRPRLRTLPCRVQADLSVNVEYLVSSLRGGPVEVDVQAPSGWVATPRSIVVNTTARGDEQLVRFSLRAAEASVAAGEVRVRCRYPNSARNSTHGYRVIEYPHIRPSALLESAVVRIVPLNDCRVPSGVRVGYVDGVGDEVPRALEILGVPCQFLTRDDLLEGDLDRFDVILTGVRAYKVREDLKAAQARILKWVEAGGTLLVQYNKLEFNAGQDESPYAPFPGTVVGRRRVTVEEAPVQLLLPQDPVLQFPNQLGAADWAGWVQERGLYFLDFQDERYLDLIRMEDPWPYNAGPKGGALVRAPYGQGHWVYLGVGLFRQLPAGVPGAYRLLANLLALGSSSR